MSRRAIAGFVLLALLLAVLGLVAPRFVRSPAQLAADRAAPALPPATAVVERRVLTDTVVVRGTLARSRRTEVVAVAAADGRAVVTGVRARAGGAARAGAVLVEVSGRPVILLEGRLPAYRDLRTGDRGPDVTQVQSALRGLGYAVTDPASRFGSSTTRAVRALYLDRGYDPPTIDGLDGSSAAGPVATATASSSGGTASPAAGVRLPLAEVVFLSGLPGRVDSVSAALGQTPTAALMTISAGPLVVTATLAPGDHALVRAGQRATLSSELLGIDASGRVSSVGALSTGSGPPGYPLRVRPVGAVDPRLVDREVRVTIAAATSSGKVLVVPLSAVSARADGSSVVGVLPRGRADGDPAWIAVRLGLDADGYVAVEPVSGSLRAGDRVVVGTGSS